MESKKRYSGASSPVTMLVLAVMLLVIFFRHSFSESQVLFANDAPLGQLKTQEGKGVDNFLGVWMELNWIGFTQPSALPNVSNILYLLSGPLAFANFYAPIALLLLGLSAFIFFRQLGLGATACILGGIATMLNTDPFSYACWGLPSLPLCMAAIFLALAALVSRPGQKAWLKAALAGLAVGFSITEGFDNGAIFSLYVAAFVVFQSWIEGRDTGRKVISSSGGLGTNRAPAIEGRDTAGKLINGLFRTAVVAMFAAFMAAQAISTLVGTQIKGIVGTQQDAETKQRHWDAATMWSLPKLETLRVAIPGLYGYRMDTPGGGNYWGRVGQTPGVPQSRHSGAGVYGGVLVVLIAAWAIARSIAKENNPFTPRERQFIWFWAAAGLVSLLLAFGRHAPFYQFIYALPYLSTIRNPVKFMHPFTICLVTLFAYGLHGLSRQYLERNLLKARSVTAQWKAWWAAASQFEKRWTLGCVALFGASLLGWLLCSSARTELVRHLQAVGFSKEFGYSEEFAGAMARFSLIEVGWYVFFLALSISAVLLALSGTLSGARAKWGAILLGVVLITDLARANAPWILYYDYKERYASNPILDLLRQAPHEHRVAARLMPLANAFLAPERDLLPPVYGQEWMQHQFPYYGVQCLDIIQMPRMPELDNAYLRGLSPTSATNLASIPRLWQLTNTRYVLGRAAYLEVLHQQIDPANKSFRVLTNFDFVPRRTIADPRAALPEDFTAMLNPQGQHAIFEMTNALPRAKLFSHWNAVTNDETALAAIAHASFNAQRTLLVSGEIPSSAALDNAVGEPGQVQITQYEAKRVQVRTQAAAPSVLLLNDKFHPDWKVWVDGKPATPLRANFIMRGVHLAAGEHTVEFRFEPPVTMLYVSLAALLVGFVLLGILILAPHTSQASPGAAGGRT